MNTFNAIHAALKAVAPTTLDNDAVCVRIHGLDAFDYWLDAVDYAEAEGLAGMLESIGVDAEAVAEITNHDWVYVDWSGDLVDHFVNDYGFDLVAYLEAVNSGLDAEVISAGLEAGISLESIEDSYRGEWESDEDYAQDLAEQCDSIPANLWGYIDWERYARDVMMDMYAVRGHYFSMAY